MTAATPSHEAATLARLVRSRVRRLYRELEELRRMTAQLDDALAAEPDTWTEETEHEREHTPSA